MTVVILFIFFVGYAAIAFEHVLRIDKAASALITGVFCWTIYILQASETETVINELLHYLGEISSILFFLLGAMTIVEIIDRHNGFELVSDKINTTSKRSLFYIITIATFFSSALLDNLTTAIVMTSLSGKLIKGKEDKLWFAGMIVIAANAGGAWSPLGDVTTTMLWIGGQITAFNIIKTLILPSLAVCILPAILIGRRFRNQSISTRQTPLANNKEKRYGLIVLSFGIGFLVFVPIFKSVTHLPPFMGMLLALGGMWILTSFLHKNEDKGYTEQRNVAMALQKIDSPSILFFLGILLAVGALEATGILKSMALFLNNTFHNEYLIGTSLGILSAIVDNVPLVAAAQGMYDLSNYPPDHAFWEFLVLTTGTGGSAIIIGSAAGVAVMGMEEIRFAWYLKNITPFALAGFIAGIAVYILQVYLIK